jgi:hypothetical protein
MGARSDEVGAGASRPGRGLDAVRPDQRRRQALLSSSREVLLVPETDDWVNPLGVKCLGELGNVGLNAAVANAVFHATGKRVRDLPVRIEKLMA